MAEIIGEYGGITGGGDLSPEFVFGVPYETWMSWSEFTREKYLVDYHRTEEQSKYYYDSTAADAFEYKNYIDEIIDETGQKYEDITDFGQEKIGDAVSIAIGLAALYLVTRK